MTRLGMGDIYERQNDEDERGRHELSEVDSLPSCKTCGNPATLRAQTSGDYSDVEPGQHNLCISCAADFLAADELHAPATALLTVPTAQDIAIWYLAAHMFGPSDVDDVRAYRAGLATTQPLPAVSMAEMVGVSR